ncbi:hypothetical protein FHS85_001480 [Rhodoligotrophos appendicifer]|uniref:hypothetical protein n=1 Tax=Rhodoligotrophos appendicifer TaxID=987056 RepID=UPI001185A1E6|nr:hypothetical protein [Rhodoligotrophos appendicifer]
MKMKPRLVEGRVEIDHGLYRIVAGAQKESCKAIAYLGLKTIQAAEAETLEEAIAALKLSLDDRVKDLCQLRVNGVPTSTEFGEAFVALQGAGLKPAIALLRLHSRRPNASASVAKLASLVEKDESAVITAYRRLGKKLVEVLAFSPEAEGANGVEASLLSFAVRERSDPSGQSFRLRTEVVEAIRSLEGASSALLLHG